MSMSNSHLSGNSIIRTPTLSVPVACRVCNKMFFDNLSLVHHFETHLEDGNSYIIGIFPSNFHARMSWARQVEFPRVNFHPRPAQLPSGSSKRAKILPDLNVVPPLSPSFDVRSNFSSHQGIGSSSYFGQGLMVLPPLRILEMNGAQYLAQYNNQNVRRVKRPIQEVVVISDDEEEENRNQVETRNENLVETQNENPVETVDWI